MEAGAWHSDRGWSYCLCRCFWIGLVADSSLELVKFSCLFCEVTAWPESCAGYRQARYNGEGGDHQGPGYRLDLHRSDWLAGVRLS